MKNRILPALLLLPLLLTGCGGGPAPKAEPGEAVPVPSPSPEAELPPSPAVPEEQSPEPVPSPLLRAEEPADTELVSVAHYFPDLAVDLRYAGQDNFTGQVIYSFHSPWLRYGTLKKLRAVQARLEPQGFRLLLWDAFRPAAAQFALWEVVPDGRYVINPYAGHSGHSEGGTVDISLAASDGSLPDLPSAFDEFSPRADRDYSDVSAEAAVNALLLQNAMEAEGFVGYYAEWWHYTDTDAYPWEDLKSIVLPERSDSVYTPLCQEYISLRTAPDYAAPVIRRIGLGEKFYIIGFCGDFLRVVHRDTEGYVAAAYVQKAEEQQKT